MHDSLSGSFLDELESHPHLKVASSKTSRLIMSHSLQVLSKTCVVMSCIEQYVLSMKASTAPLFHLNLLPDIPKTYQTVPYV